MAEYNEREVNEFRKVRRNFRITGTVALGVLAIGSVFYHQVEKLAWLNSFYFCTITLTTIGYGDIVPTTNAGKLFTIFYVLLGIGIIASFANISVKNAVLRRQIKSAKKKSSKP